MKSTSLLFVIFIMIVCVSCESAKEKQVKQILELEKKLSPDSLDTGWVQINPINIQNVIQAYNDFANKYPDDTLSAVFLFKSSELLMGLQKYNEAIKYLDKICKEHPNSPKAPSALFFQAFIYENNLNNIEQARQLYTLFIEKYPNHELVESARFSLKNLGKSNEEIIKEFEKNLQKDSVNK